MIDKILEVKKEILSYIKNNKDNVIELSEKYMSNYNHSFCFETKKENLIIVKRDTYEVRFQDMPQNGNSFQVFFCTKRTEFKENSICYENRMNDSTYNLKIELDFLDKVYFDKKIFCSSIDRKLLKIFKEVLNDLENIKIEKRIDNLYKILK